jgi:hypothetical protein
VKEIAMNYRTDDRVEEPSLMPSNPKEFMHRVPIEKVKKWGNNNGHYHPTSIDAKCGYCQQWSNLVCENPSFHGQSKGFTLHGRCVRCDQQSRVFVDNSSSAAYHFDEMWILPKPEVRESAFLRFENEIPTRILRAYNTAVKSFDLGLWGGCITECGRALEGITRDKFPESIRLNKKDEEVHLGIKLQRLQTEAQKLGDIESLLKPIIELSEALRLGRNTSAHFDVEKEPDDEAALLVLELAEYLMSYFYVIPRQAKILEETIQALSPADEEEKKGGGEDPEPLAAGQIPAPPIAEVVVDSEDSRAGTAP